MKERITFKNEQTVRVGTDIFSKWERTDSNSWPRKEENKGELQEDVTLSWGGQACMWVGGGIKKVYGEIHRVWKVEVVSQGKRNTIQVDRGKG